MLAYDVERAQETVHAGIDFKVPHALFALDAGAVRDEFQVIRWDGVKQDFDGWNQDQTLRSSMRHSTVWVYQQFAREIGEVREKEYLTRIQYGNADPSGGVDRFWLDGALRISAMEQVDFLRKLYRNELPFKVEHQRLVKDIMIVEAGRDWIRRAKTGWQARVEPQIGWWVGWVETPTGAVIFALNIDLPGGMKRCAETGGDCPIDTPVDRSTSALKHARVFMVHLTFVNRSPLRNWMRSSRS